MYVARGLGGSRGSNGDPEGYDNDGCDAVLVLMNSLTFLYLPVKMFKWIGHPSTLWDRYGINRTFPST